MNITHTITTELTVSRGDLNANKILDPCKILSITTSHTDTAIQRMTGVLDYSYVNIDYYSLDFVGTAQLNDVVIFQSHAYYADGELIEIILTASKKQGHANQVFVNGSFLLTVKQSIPSTILVH